MEYYQNPIITYDVFKHSPTSIHIHQSDQRHAESIKMNPESYEMSLRVIGTTMIQSAGKLLRLPRVTIASAQVIFMRFYYQQSMDRLGIEDVAMGALLLATKLEECSRRVRDIVNVFHYLHHRLQRLPDTSVTPILHYIGSEYYDWRDRVTFAENIILRELGFDLEIYLPYGLIINYCQLLDLLNTKVCEKALGFLNDSLRTVAHVCFQPNIIACACIQMASNFYKFTLPMQPQWFLIFDVGAEELDAVARLIVALYNTITDELLSLATEEFVLSTDTREEENINETLEPCKDDIAKKVAAIQHKINQDLKNKGPHAQH